MIIKQDDIAPFDGSLETETNEYVIRSAVEVNNTIEIHYLSHETMTEPNFIPRGERPKGYEELKNAGASLLIRGLHHSFNRHLPFALTPQMIWSTLLDVAKTTVTLNPKEYKSKFGVEGGGQKELTVYKNSVHPSQCDWMSYIPTFKGLLEKQIPKEVMELFCPAFSTLTPVIEISQLITFMGAVTPYYTFNMGTSCGIPEIKLTGTHEDWKLLVEHTKKLADFFPKLAEYYDVLIPILEKIEQSWVGETVDKKFWRSIYHYNSESGSDYVSGWINTLYAYEFYADWFNRRSRNKEPHLKKSFTDWMRQDTQTSSGGIRTEGGIAVNHFPSQIVTVPFTWETSVNGENSHLSMAFVAGPMSIELLEDKYICPKLGFGVVEYHKY